MDLKTLSKSSPKMCMCVFFLNTLFHDYMSHLKNAAKGLTSSARGYFGLNFSVVWSVLGGKVSIGRYEVQSPDLKIGICWSNTVTRFPYCRGLFLHRTTPTMRVVDHHGY